MTPNLKEFVNHRVPMQDNFQSDIFPKDHVVILMALYNGAATLPDQLTSITKQTHKNWSLIVSDDGSHDDWMTPMKAFAARHEGQTTLAQGPQKGSTQNFLELIRLAGPTVPFAALCDQDDGWLECKLERALYALADISPSTPALYVAPTFICDRELNPIRRSKFFRYPPCFANALVQSIGGGNTMVLNRAALDLVQETAQYAGSVKAHDWWIYQLITGADGIVRYDQNPSVLYRQHGANQVGANDTPGASFHRLLQVLRGRFRRWNEANVNALEAASYRLTPCARETLEKFQVAREGTIFVRLAAVRRAGLFRQTLRGQFAMWLAAALKRL